MNELEVFKKIADIFCHAFSGCAKCPVMEVCGRGHCLIVPGDRVPKDKIRDVILKSTSMAMGRSIEGEVTKLVINLPHMFSGKVR